MKTYKKPISILVEVDFEDLMDISQGQILNPGTGTEAKELGNGGYTDETIKEADAKGFGSWE